MKDNIIKIIALTVILFVVGLVFGLIYEGSENKNMETKQEEQMVVDSSTYETRTMNIDDPYVDFDIKYPHFFFASAMFNEQIKKLIDEAVLEHREYSKANWIAMYETDKSLKEKPSEKNDKFDFFVDFSIVQSNQNYISFVLKYGGYSGGAHGYETKKSFAYDLVNQKEITLSDLYEGDPQYLNTISLKTREVLEKKILEESENQSLMEDEKERKEYIENILEMMREGSGPSLDNFSNFTFTKDKIKIYFGQYQVFPYAMGAPEVEIDR